LIITATRAASAGMMGDRPCLPLIHARVHARGAPAGRPRNAERRGVLMSNFGRRGSTPARARCGKS